jgi:peptide/nickel transport system permease protein
MVSRGFARYLRMELAYTWRLVRSSPLTMAGLAIVAALTAIAIAVTVAPGIVLPYPEDIGAVSHPDLIHAPPSWSHPFGCDEMGRDILTRVLYGTRVSFFASFMVVSIGFIVGTIIGLVAGYFGGRIDNILMRITDAFLSIPNLVLALAIAATLGRGLWNAIIALAVTWWPWYARLVRSTTLSVKNEAYVIAARISGAGPFYIMFRHILPNAIGPAIINATLDLGFAILAIAALGFLGLGARPPTPEWGLMISIARRYLPEMWWEATFPGIMIFIAVLGFNLLGDGLRDILDPRFRRGVRVWRL